MTADIALLVETIHGLRGRGATIAPLDGGITNRNYRVEAEGEVFVLRIAGENTGLLGIDRAHEHQCASAAAQLGVGPEVIAFLPKQAALVTRFCTGAVLTAADAQRPDIVARIVRSLQKVHAGPVAPGDFCGFQVARDYRQMAAERGVALPAELDQAIEHLRRVEQTMGLSGPARFCHNDLLPSNLIDDGQQVWIIDWEYAAMGDPFFDLGNLAENHLLNPDQEEALLRLYLDTFRSEDLGRLRAMRAVSALREATWGYLQSAVSTLDFDFLGYANEHLKRCQELTHA